MTTSQQEQLEAAQAEVDEVTKDLTNMFEAHHKTGIAIGDKKSKMEFGEMLLAKSDNPEIRSKLEEANNSPAARMMDMMVEITPIAFQGCLEKLIEASIKLAKLKIEEVQK